MPDPVKDPTMQEVMEAVNALQRDVEEKGSVDPEKLEKINQTLDAHESKNQELIAEIKEAEKREEELKERMDALELEVARESKSNPKDYKESEHFKAIDTYVKGGDRALGDNQLKFLKDYEEKATMRTDNDTLGGYLVQSEIEQSIIKKITEISGLRSVARVRTINRKTLEMPTREGLLTAFYEGETEQDQEGNSDYGKESLTAFRLSVTVPITLDLLMDSSFNMESEIFGDAGEAFAQKEGNKFILGTNVKQPEGITVNPTVVANARTSETSATVTADDMIRLTGDLKTGYNPVYVLNRKTLAHLRTLKSASGGFLWQPGMDGPVANTINGFPYVLAIDMPDIASNSLSVAFGDFMRGYVIVDRTGVNIIRDDFAKKRQAIVEFTIHRWNYGKVVLPEAIKLLKTKA